MGEGRKRPILEASDVAFAHPSGILLSYFAEHISLLQIENLGREDVDFYLRLEVPAFHWDIASVIRRVVFAPQVGNVRDEGCGQSLSDDLNWLLVIWKSGHQRGRVSSSIFFHPFGFLAVLCAVRFCLALGMQ